jgi:hypothetical protein
MTEPVRLSETQSFVLSREERAQLCGSPQKKHQIGFLKLNGIPHYVDAHGWPVVVRSAVDPTLARVAESRAWKSRKVA